MLCKKVLTLIIVLMLTAGTLRGSASDWVKGSDSAAVHSSKRYQHREAG